MMVQPQELSQPWVIFLVEIPVIFVVVSSLFGMKYGMITG